MISRRLSADSGFWCKALGELIPGTDRARRSAGNQMPNQPWFWGMSVGIQRGRYRKSKHVDGSLLRGEVD